MIPVKILKRRARRRAEREQAPTTGPRLEALEQRTLMSASTDVIAQLLSGLTSTDSDVEMSMPIDPNLTTGQVTPSTTNSTPLINLNTFREDSLFAGIDGSGYATVIIDTGIDLNHPFFGPDSNGNGVADRIVYQWDFADNDSNASDANNHGSNVASIAASSDSVYTGMAPGADIIVLKVFKNTGSGTFGYVEDALQWVVANALAYNIVSVNMSLGDEENYANAVSLYGMGDELAALEALNVIVVAAAGNDFGGAQGVSYPAADPNIIGVGAVVTSGTGTTVASFSQRDDTLSDIFAPGTSITGANRDGGTVTMSGTSQAAPHIAGLAVLAQDLAMRELGRRLTPDEFLALMKSTGVTFVDSITGLTFQRVDAYAMGLALVSTSPQGAGTGEIRGMVWNDLDGDGAHDAGEPGLASRTVYLDDNQNGQRDGGEVVAFTGPDGTYSFTNLAAGTYYVAQLVPSGAVQTSPGQGGSGFLGLVAHWDDTDEGVTPSHEEEPPAGGSGQTWADVWAEGDYAYLGHYNADSSVDIVDMQDIDHLHLAARWTAPIANLQFADVQVTDGIGYFGSDNGGGVFIVDLSDPHHPVTLSHVSSANGGHNNVHTLYVDGDYLYEADSRSTVIKVIDVSDPANPVFVRNIISPTGGSVHEVTVRDGRMYTAVISSNGRAEIFDVSNIGTADAVFLGATPNAPFAHTSWSNEDGTLLAVAREVGGGDVRLYDITDPANPILRSTISGAAYGIEGHTPHQPMIVGDRMYVAWYQAGTVAFDISDPANPVLLGSYDTFPGTGTTYEGNWGVYALLGPDRILAIDMQSGLYVLSTAETRQHVVTLAEGQIVTGIDFGTEMPPFNVKFDFGTAASPVAIGYKAATHATSYTAALAYGWAGGGGFRSSYDTAIGSDAVTRDYVYTTNSTFLVDAPNGLYDITITLGDLAGATTDQQSISIEGVQVDLVTVPGGQTATKTYTGIALSDGQLTILLQDLGGSNAYVGISELRVVRVGDAGPDTAAPTVALANPANGASILDATLNAQGYIEVTYADAGGSGVSAASITDGAAEFTLGGAGAANVTVNGAGTLVAGTTYRYAFTGSFVAGAVNVSFVAGSFADGAGNLNIAGAQAFTVTTPPPVPTFTRQFDFGTASSPVASGYTGATHTTNYSAAQTYGWATGGGFRGSWDTALGSSAVTRDYVYTTNSTFLVDAPNGVYDITITLGDLAGATTDQQAITIEGVQVDNVTVPGGQTVTKTYSGITLIDGQLTILLQDLGGSNPYVGISELRVAKVGESGPDTAAPTVALANPANAASVVDATLNAQGYIEVTYADTGGSGVSQASITDGAAEFTLSGAGAAGVTVGAATLVSGTTYRYAFTGSFVAGAVTLNFAAGSYSDVIGNLNAASSQSFTVTTAPPAPPFSKQFDFGTASSPVASGYTGATHTTSYSTAQTYGWATGGGFRGSWDTALGSSAVTRDYVYTTNSTFLVDAPDGLYDITITLGDLAGATTDQQSITIEGVQVDLVTVPGGQTVTKTYSNIALSDGQLTILLQDMGGSNPYVGISELRVAKVGESGPDTAAPTVTLASPANGASVVDATLNAQGYIEVTYADTGGSGVSHASITDATDEFTLSGAGAAGVTVSGAATLVSGTTYRYAFTGAFVPGAVTLNFAAGSYADVTGNLSVASTQSFTVTATPPFSRQFDFGTAVSPVANGYTGVTHTTSYSTAQTYGWATGGGFRSSWDTAIGSNAVTRDYVYTTNSTFLVDAPNGTYNVTITLGDLAGATTDNQAITIEGILVDNVTVPGGQTVTKTYTVTVSDGQLTLLLQDMGGTNPYVGISELRVLKVG